MKGGDNQIPKSNSDNSYEFKNTTIVFGSKDIFGNLEKQLRDQGNYKDKVDRAESGETKPILGNLVNGIKIDIDSREDGQLIVKDSKNLLLTDVLKESMSWNSANPKSVIILDLIPTAAVKESLESVINQEMDGNRVARDQDIEFINPSELDLSKLVDKERRLVIVSTALNNANKSENVLYGSPSKIITGARAKKIIKGCNSIKIEQPIEKSMADEVKEGVRYVADNIAYISYKHGNARLPFYTYSAANIICDNIDRWHDSAGRSLRKFYEIATTDKMPGQLKSAYYLFRQDIKEKIIKPIAKPVNMLIREFGHRFADLNKDNDGALILMTSVLAGILKSKEHGVANISSITKNAYIKQIINELSGSMALKFGKGEDLYNSIARVTKKSSAVIVDEAAKKLSTKDKRQLALYCAADMAMQVCVNYFIRSSINDALGIDDRPEPYQRFISNLIALPIIEGVKSSAYQLSNYAAEFSGIRKYSDISPLKKKSHSDESDSKNSKKGFAKKVWESEARGLDTAFFGIDRSVLKITESIVQLPENFKKFYETVERDYISQELKIAFEKYSNNNPNLDDLSFEEICKGVKKIMLDEGIVEQDDYIDYIMDEIMVEQDDFIDYIMDEIINKKLLEKNNQDIELYNEPNNMQVAEDNSLSDMDLDGFSTGIIRGQSNVDKIDADKDEKLTPRVVSAGDDKDEKLTPQVASAEDSEWTVVIGNRRSGKRGFTTEQVIDHNLDKKSHILAESNRRNWKEDLEKEHKAKDHKNFEKGSVSNSNGRQK